jgi:hypothetical protein
MQVNVAPPTEKSSVLGSQPVRKIIAKIDRIETITNFLKIKLLTFVLLLLCISSQILQYFWLSVISDPQQLHLFIVSPPV